jgi:hypothetical protein
MYRASKYSGLALLGLTAALAWPSPAQAYNMSQNASDGWMNSSSRVACTDVAGFTHWGTSDIDWYLNTSGQGAGKASAVQGALAAWNNAGTEYNLNYAGTTTGTYNMGGQGDGKNTFYWGIDGFCDTRACHAVTARLLEVKTTTPNGQVILESDILFNANPDPGFLWMTDGQYSNECWNTVGSSGLKLDTQGIATHELGHSLGINHPTVLDTSPTAPTMANACTPDAQSLASDDINALACSENRYPQDPSYYGNFSTGTCRSISGSAANANRESHASYVEVVESMSNGTPRIAVVRPASPVSNQFSYVPGSGNPDDQLMDGNWHTIRVRHTGTGQELSGGPKSIICGVPLFSGQPGSSAHISTGGTPYEVATQFSSTHGGYISHLRYYFPGNGETGARTARLWSNTGTQLGSVSLTPPSSFGGIGWVEKALSTKVQIQPNVLYRVSITTYTEQSKTACGLSSPMTNGPLTAHQGFWSAGDGTASPIMPATSSCSNYWVSVKFET